MSDHVITIEYNVGNDATPDWSSTDLNFGGTSGANELRFIESGGAGNVSSANWGYTTRPAAVEAVNQLWAYTTDTAGLQVATYDGGRTNARVLRLVHTSAGTYASAPRWTAFASSSHPTPSAGTQVDNPTDGANIINGHATDTSSTSYLKGNGYGSGLTAGGTQETPSAGAVGTTLAATSGTAGSVSPSAGAWLATWQSLQGFVQYITLPAIPQAATAHNYYLTLALYMGPNMKPGIMPFAPVVRVLRHAC